MKVNHNDRSMTKRERERARDTDKAHPKQIATNVVTPSQTPSVTRSKEHSILLNGNGENQPGTKKAKTQENQNRAREICETPKKLALEENLDNSRYNNSDAIEIGTLLFETVDCVLLVPTFVCSGSLKKLDIIPYSTTYDSQLSQFFVPNKTKLFAFSLKENFIDISS